MTAALQVLQPVDQFLCSHYACTLTARACVLRQDHRYRQRLGGGAGMVRSEQRVPLEFEFCASGRCEQGRGIRAAVAGQVIEPARKVDVQSQWWAKRRAEDRAALLLLEAPPAIAPPPATEPEPVSSRIDPAPTQEPAVRPPPQRQKPQEAPRPKHRRRRRPRTRKDPKEQIVAAFAQAFADDFTRAFNRTLERRRLTIHAQRG